MRKELKVLKDHAEQPPHLRARWDTRDGCGWAAGYASPTRISPSSKRIQAVDRTQQGRLAGPAGTDQGHGLPGIDREADVVQHQAMGESLGDDGGSTTCISWLIGPSPSGVQIARQMAQRHRHDQIQAWP